MFNPIKLISSLFGLIWSVIIIGALSYYFFPAGYAFAAYHSGVLPVTDHIKQASPGLWYEYQELLLSQATEQLSQNRDRLSENRDRLQSEAAIYQDKAHQAQVLLAQARELYKTSPNAGSFRFIGKEYTPSAFSVQVVVLKGQLDAANQSIAALQGARVKLEDTWVMVAKKSAQLSADHTRLATARILWDTKRILGGLEIDVDLGEVREISRHDIRTVEELLEDAARIQPPSASPDVSQGNDLTAEAIAILTAG